MKWLLKKWPPVVSGLLVAFIFSAGPWSMATAQSASDLAVAPKRSETTPSRAEISEAGTGKLSLTTFFDPIQGSSSNDLVRRALSSNGELAAARIEIERARARLRQAGLRPNPTLDFEHSTGRALGSPGENETNIGLA